MIGFPPAQEWTEKILNTFSSNEIGYSYICRAESRSQESEANSTVTPGISPIAQRPIVIPLLGSGYLVC